MNTLGSIALIALASIFSFILGNIFNNSVEKRYFQTQRKLLLNREQKMRRQYRDMENALVIAKGYRSDERERERE